MGRTIYELKDGIKLHFLNSDKYKTDLSCIIMTVPLERETVTKNALIPFILRRGSKLFPDQYLINKEMENLYGAEFNCGIDKIGDNLILKFYIESINNDYALNDENILKLSIRDLFDITFNPITENNFMKKSFFETEIETLRKVIESKIDNKDLYAYDKCIETMYDDKFGLYKYGYIEDLDKITFEDISQHYDWLIQNSKIDIFISGKNNNAEIKEFVENNENIKKLNPRDENIILNNEFTECKKIVEKPKEILENMNVTQGKLVMSLDVVSKVDNVQTIANIYNEILGGSANSMLFQNVREKAGLAYSAKSNFVKQKMNIFIRCGIQIENYEKTIELIKVQLKKIEDGKFTDEDLEDAKTSLISAIKTLEEEQDTEMVYYIGQELSKTDLEPTEYIEKINSVTREDIIDLANSVYLNTIYFLRS